MNRPTILLTNMAMYMTTNIWKLLKPWNQVHNDYLNHIKVANQNMPTSIYDYIIVISSF